MTNKLSRRELLKMSTIGVAGLFGTKIGSLLNNSSPAGQVQSPLADGDEHGHGKMGMVGEVDHEANQFNPHDMLYDFDYGTVSTLSTGQTLREYEIFAIDKEIEIAPGIYFPGWVYGSPTSPESVRAGHMIGRVPGPSIRCVEGDRIKITFTNASSHPHTIHFHGIHGATMDGVPGVGAGEIGPGESTIYEFDAAPFGSHLYHCHALPLKRHIHKGLYGAFIIDPDPEKYEGEERDIAASRNHNYPENKDVQEMVMVMNGFDTNFDGDNEVYTVNSIAFAYMNKPIKIKHDKLVRIHLSNLTEFDPINSIHIHANFFNYFDHGTTLQPTLKIVDTIMQCQAQRGIIEVSFKDFEPGLYMFHAHQSEFAELGWMGFFEVER